MAQQTPSGAATYKPMQDEEYMNPRQLGHFRRLLEKVRRELSRNNERGAQQLQQEQQAVAEDQDDRASQEAEMGIEVFSQERESRLVNDIDTALERIENGEYGYCRLCGTEIGLRRLEAVPTTTLCINCKTQREALLAGQLPG